MTGSLSAVGALGALPCKVGNETSDLVLCFVEEEMAHPLWIVASKEAYALPRVRKFMKFVADNMPKDDRR